MTFKYIYIYIYTYIHKYTHINPQGIGLVIFKASWDPSSRKKKKEKEKEKEKEEQKKSYEIQSSWVWNFYPPSWEHFKVIPPLKLP